MASPARALPAEDVRRLLEYVTTQRHPDRNRVIVLLSFKAGLRACEIAGLDWTAVLRPDGSIGDQLVIPNAIAKMGSGRRIPLHPDLRAGLQALHRKVGRPSAARSCDPSEAATCRRTAWSTGSRRPTPLWR